MFNKKYTVLGETIQKGKGAQLNLDIAKLHTRTKIEVPVIVQRGKKDGPTLLITGGIHGNEINGVEIVRQIVSKKYNRPESGMVICIPVVNIFGFLNQARQFPDGRDLNRVFPGSLRGSLASRFAYHLIKDIAPIIDCCIDYHTGGDSRFNAPQIRIDKDDEDGLALAKIFGAEFIVKSAGREKSFRETLHQLDKEVLLYEGGKSLHIDKEITDTGIVGALRVMQHLGMRDFSEEISQMSIKPITPKLVNASKWLRAKHSGMFHPLVKVGQNVEKGAELGNISGPFGYFERKITAKESGFIICINESPIVNQGDAIFHIAYDVD
ncbi:hypothetical protein LCGC14_0198790 [marine sediment metagenome]|uniref:Succinylglutamate desuccinylase/Aspartoacylase catalytic domain-containing protein n=1 Tax=marine sediment metagenome TaxID=412755 RepID=A0A0F9X3Q3_9ZZZZ|nr:succinylglutamate desuccinylase/aspartoacylase family protein [Maribacter sp.]HDZ04743.1 succinylglutamate desuccinylase/aspartoacylase family protein [Maribacter sp.]HEA81826.1 succinylglutamate desuccinylase/aspartoacylase family protein [Maribacter sp.]